MRKSTFHHATLYTLLLALLAANAAAVPPSARSGGRVDYDGARADLRATLRSPALEALRQRLEREGTDPAAREALGVVLHTLRRVTVAGLRAHDVEAGIKDFARATATLRAHGVTLGADTQTRVEEALLSLRAPFAPRSVAPARLRWRRPVQSLIAKALAEVSAGEARFPLEVRFADGESYRTSEEAPEITIRFNRKRAELETAALGYVGLMEAYFRGDVDIDGRNALDKLIHMSKLTEDKLSRPNPLVRAAQGILEARKDNRSYAQARTNAMDHYGLPARFFRLMLGRTYGYTEGFYPIGNESLTDAQHKSFDIVAQRLRLDRPGLRVLEVGAGWGYNPILMALKYGADVTNVGLVPEQNRVLEDLIDGNGLRDRVRTVEMDHRDIGKLGQFDRYVSIGVFEHAGRSQHEAWIKSISDALAPGGYGVLSTMSHANRQLTDYLITKHIFPGGYIPSKAQTISLMEKYGLEATESVNLRQHYGYAVQDWHERLMLHWDEIRALNPALFNESFRRTWSLYLLGSAHSFSGPGDALTVDHISFRKGRGNGASPQVNVTTVPHERVAKHLP